MLRTFLGLCPVMTMGASEAQIASDGILHAGKGGD